MRSRSRGAAATVALVADGLWGLYAARLQQGGMPLKDGWSTGEHPWGSRENWGPRQLSSTGRATGRLRRGRHDAHGVGGGQPPSLLRQSNRTNPCTRTEKGLRSPEAVQCALTHTGSNLGPLSAAGGERGAVPLTVKRLVGPRTAADPAPLGSLLQTPSLSRIPMLGLAAGPASLIIP